MRVFYNMLELATLSKSECGLEVVPEETLLNRRWLPSKFGIFVVVWIPYDKSSHLAAVTVTCARFGKY